VSAVFAALEGSLKMVVIRYSWL